MIIRATSRSEGGSPSWGWVSAIDDGAGVEDLADQAGGAEGDDRQHQDEDVDRAVEVDVGDVVVDRDRVDQPQRDEDEDGQRQQRSPPS